VTQLRRSFEIAFESLDEIMQIFTVAGQRDPTKITGHEMPFGKSGMTLSQSEYIAYFDQMVSLQNAMGMIHSTCGHLAQNLAFIRVEGEFAIDDTLDHVNDDLNDILFESDTVEEAVPLSLLLGPAPLIVGNAPKYDGRHILRAGEHDRRHDIGNSSLAG
jgi:hypothetical protein